MTKHTHFVLACQAPNGCHNVWHEPIPTTKLAIGEHRLCPKCGGSTWINVDAPRITKEAPAAPIVAEAPKAIAIPADLIPQHADPAEEHVLTEEEYLDDEQSEETDTGEA